MSISETVSPPVDEIVHSSSSAAIELREIWVRLSCRSLLADADLGRDLLVGRDALEAVLELDHRALDLTRAAAHGARDPVERAELVDDRALDARDRVGLELDVAVELVALDRADQPEQAVRDEVAFLDVRREAGAEPPCHVLDERRVGQDEAIPQVLAAVRLVPAPDVLQFAWLGFCHA